MRLETSNSRGFDEVLDDREAWVQAALLPLTYVECVVCKLLANCDDDHASCLPWRDEMTKCHSKVKYRNAPLRSKARDSV